MPRASATEAIAANVRRLRSVLKFTQATLAEAVDASPETISRIERGQMEPGADLLARLAQALGTSMDTLAGLHEDAPVHETRPEIQRIVRRLRRLDRRTILRVAAVIELIPQREE